MKALLHSSDLRARVQNETALGRLVASYSEIYNLYNCLSFLIINFHSYSFSILYKINFSAVYNRKKEDFDQSKNICFSE
jgi:hypothetical protein